MAIYIYKPLSNIVLGYAQERICEYLKEHDEVTSFELYKLTSKRSKPLKQLLDKGIVIKNQKGTYELRKPVACYTNKAHYWMNHTIEELLSHEPDFLADIEDMPSLVKEELFKKGYSFRDYSYIDFRIDVDQDRKAVGEPYPVMKKTDYSILFMSELDEEQRDRLKFGNNAAGNYAEML